MNAVAQTIEAIRAEEIAAIIAAQNDKFRRNIALPPAGFPADTPGETDVPDGRVVITNGVEAQGPAFVVEALRKIAAFDDFTDDCDPGGRHEMGAVEIDGQKVWFKIDLYDRDYRFGGDAPADPEQTRRVLTVLFPDEW